MRPTLRFAFAALAVSACGPLATTVPAGPTIPEAPHAAKPAPTKPVLDRPVAPLPLVDVAAPDGSFRTQAEGITPPTYLPSSEGHTLFSLALRPPAEGLSTVFCDATESFHELAWTLNGVTSGLGRVGEAVEVQISRSAPKTPPGMRFTSRFKEPSVTVAMAGTVGAVGALVCFGAGIPLSDLVRISDGAWSHANFGADDALRRTSYGYTVTDSLHPIGLEFRDIAVFVEDNKPYERTRIIRLGLPTRGPASSSVTFTEGPVGGPASRVTHRARWGSTDGSDRTVRKTDAGYNYFLGDNAAVPFTSDLLFGSELSLRAELHRIAGGGSFSYFDGVDRNGDTVTPTRVTLAHRAPNVLDEVVHTDVDRLEIAPDGVVTRETHFVEEGTPAGDAHVREQVIQTVAF